MPDAACAQLNAVMEVVNQQAIMLEDQVSLFERVVGGSTGYALNTTTTLMLSPDYWQALGTSFVDMVRHLMRALVGKHPSS
jgi:hypothetical protein